MKTYVPSKADYDELASLVLNGEKDLTNSAFYRNAQGAESVYFEQGIETKILLQAVRLASQSDHLQSLYISFNELDEYDGIEVAQIIARSNIRDLNIYNGLSDYAVQVVEILASSHLHTLV